MTRNDLPQGVALVTGAAGGMGSATARKLATEGWPELLLCDVSEERLEAVAAPLREGGVKADVLAGNIADPAFPRRLVEALGDRPIAALVHAAGISPAMGSAEQILAVNLDATVRLVDAVRDRMAPGSAAVLFASNSSYFPMAPEAAAAFTAPLPAEGTAALLHLVPDPDRAYPLSKLGVRALVKREARSFGERGARLVSLSPGAIDTPMLQAESVARERSRNQPALRMIEDSPFGRMGRADEVATVAAFLCSPDASFVVASDVLVDGGHTAALGL